MQDKNTAKISVIVPVYNAQDYLAQCVESISSQTYGNLEILLVDDGSIDKSGDLCEEYALKDKRIHVVHKQNGGLVSAWKAGVEKSTGDYLFFVDSDDWIDHDLLEKLAGKLVFREDEIIASGYLIERENGRTPERKENGAAPGEYTGKRLSELQGNAIGNENRFIWPSRCMKLFARKLFLENMMYIEEDIRMGEDLLVTLPCILSCKRLVVVETCGYHYRFVRESMVHRFDPGLYGNVRKLHDILLQIAGDRKIPDGKTKADREFLFLMFVELKNQLRRDADKKTVTEAVLKEIKKERLKDILDAYPKKLTDPASKLLAILIRHPNALTAALIRCIFLARR